MMPTKVATALKLSSTSYPGAKASKTGPRKKMNEGRTMPVRAAHSQPM